MKYFMILQKALYILKKMRKCISSLSISYYYYYNIYIYIENVVNPISYLHNYCISRFKKNKKCFK